jgi:hypothetical protein
MRGLSKILIFLILFSCNKKDNSSFKEVDDSAIRYKLFQLEDMGWKSKKHSQQIDDLNFTAIEVPIQYYILKDQGKSDLFNVDSLYNQNKFERIIEFTFEQEEEKDLLHEEFTNLTTDESIKYMSFKVENDFYVVTSKNDTIKCSGVTFERNFKVAPLQKLILFFSGISPEEKIQLVYNDKLFRKGIIKFKFEDQYKEILQ